MDELFNPQTSSVTSSRILYPHQPLCGHHCSICRRLAPYRPSTRICPRDRIWCHCYALFLPAVYERYKERGGRPVFHPDDLTPFFTSLLTNLYDLASSSDYIRDMRINEKLGTLRTLRMEQSWHQESVTVSRKLLELSAVKDYLSKIFKETYGTTVNNYLIAKRITRAKQLLRFTDMTVDEVDVDGGRGDVSYFSRMFRKGGRQQPKRIPKTVVKQGGVVKIAHLYLYNKTAKMTTSH